MLLDLFRNKAKGFSDLLPYAFCVENGIIMQKDGSFITGYEYVGYDNDSSTSGELESITRIVSMALMTLGGEFMVHTDAIRSYKKAYPSKELSCYTDIATEIIDEERRQFFDSDVCFFTRTKLVITYKPRNSLVIATNIEKEKSYIEKSLHAFKNAIHHFEDALSSVVYMQRLLDYEIDGIKYSSLLSHIQECITSEKYPVRLPDNPMYLDCVMGSVDFVGGISPKINDELYIQAIGIDAFPYESYPTMLSFLSNQPCEYRFNTRFIFLDKDEAEHEIKQFSKGWNQQIFSAYDQIMDKQQTTNNVNRDAAIMREDAEIAKVEVQANKLGAGFITCNIILFHENLETLEELSREFRKLLKSDGFGCRIETINNIEAYLGSLPGASYPNIRRPMVTTLNLADILPLSTIYKGSSVAPSPFFKKNSRPLAVVTTENGSSPFWLNLHVDDLGHTLIFGPTGAGKSTLLGFLIAQFKTYENAKVYAFDKGMSLYTLTKASNGLHFEIGSSDDKKQPLSFAPLAKIDESEREFAFCQDFIETLLKMHNYPIVASDRNEITEALKKLKNQPESMRSLSNFSYLVQNIKIKEALAYYTINGAMGYLLDAQEDNLDVADFMTFEVEELMGMSAKNYVPVLLYIFYRIEKSLKGDPTLLVLDEAWLMLSDDAFREKIREWLKVFRKANCAVVMATQSLSDAKRSGIMDVLVESCPTKILLPNANAMQDEQQELYKNIGLNIREIEIIKDAIPKKDYYITSTAGKRLIQLALGDKTLSFIGISDKESIKKVKTFIEQFGENNWQNEWINECK